MAGSGRRVADPPQTNQSAGQNDYGHDKSNAKSNALGTQNHDAVIGRQSVGELEIPLDDFGQVGKKLGVAVPGNDGITGRKMNDIALDKITGRQNPADSK